MKKHLFVIGEDKRDLMLLLDIFKRSEASYKCTYASGGMQALEMMRYLSFDIVFIQYKIPGIDALQLASAVRFENGLKELKLCLFGQNFYEEKIKLAKLLGVSYCIEKELGEDEVYRQVCDILWEGETCRYAVPVTTNYSNENKSYEKAHFIDR